MDLRSEFAVVSVEIDNQANGPRLLIEDRRTGRTIYLDPLELESLTLCEHRDLATFLNPSWKAWKSAPTTAIPQSFKDMDIKL